MFKGCVFGTIIILFHDNTLGMAIKNKYPLSRINDMFDQLRGAKVFSKIDLRLVIISYILKMSKTTFKTCYGHYELMVVPFGLANASCAFICLTKVGFREYLDKFLIVFLDDILIHFMLEEDDKQHFKLVLQVLKENQLYAKLCKC